MPHSVSWQTAPETLTRRKKAGASGRSRAAGSPYVCFFPPCVEFRFHITRYHREGRAGRRCVCGKQPSVWSDQSFLSPAPLFTFPISLPSYLAGKILLICWQFRSKLSTLILTCFGIGLQTVRQFLRSERTNGSRWWIGRRGRRETTETFVWMWPWNVFPFGTRFNRPASSCAVSR